MKITVEELRKVYEDGRQAFIKKNRFCYSDEANGSGFLALARFVAQRQRDMSPTEEMLRTAVKESEGEAVYKVMTADGLARLEQAAFDQYRAMQSVAPLVVDKEAT